MAIQDDSSVALIPSAYGTSKVYSVIPSNGNGDFTFSRSGSATRVNKGGYIETMGSNVPRLDYPLIDGVVQDCPALLLEPSRTNYVTYSEAISNTTPKSGTFTDNFAISPDGSQNATKLTATNTDPYFYQNFTFSSTTYTMSIYVKGIGDAVGKEFQMRIGGTSPYDTFEIPSEWTRFTATKTVSASTSNFGLEIPNPAVSGDEVLVWGWQLEAGSYATSYIPTSGSTATRSADVCNGSGTSAEFNDSEGVLFAEIAALANDGTTRRMSLSDSSTSDRIVIGYLSTNNQFQFLINSNSSDSAFAFISVPSVLDFNKVAIKYKQNDFAFWINGVEVSTDSSGNTPIGLSELAFDDGVGGNDFYGKSKQLMTFKTALTDSELETLTSWDSFNAMAKGQLYTIE